VTEELRLHQIYEEGNYNFLDSHTPDEGRIEDNENFYSQLQEILTLTKIFISGDLNTRIGNAEIHNFVGLLKNQ
jgi:hypothetical protein